jgi:SAM-dependent methyltransferase
MKRAVLSTVCASCLALVVSAQTKARPAEPDVPYAATPRDIVRAMLIAARVSPADVVFDLGCGDGRVLIMAAQEFGARGVGVDIDSRRVRQARTNVHEAGVDGLVGIWQEDMFAVDLRPATVVVLYLSHKVNNRLRPKLLRELRAGTRIVSHNVDMGNWTPDTVGEVNGHRIYGWFVPPKQWFLAPSKTK